MSAGNFGGTFDQLFLRIFFEMFTENASLFLLYHGAKKSKMTKNSNQGSYRGERGEIIASLSHFLDFYTKHARAFKV